jgi:hypothetical protein
MSPWVPVVSAGVFAILGIAERFYVRFVPDVNDQKRHLRFARQAAFLAFSLFSLILGFWDAAHQEGPVTPGSVLFVGSLFFSLTLFVILLLLTLALRFLVAFGQFLDMFGQHLYITSEIAKIVGKIAPSTEAPDEISEKLQDILKQLHGGSSESAR